MINETLKKKYAILTFKWCKKNLGIPKRKKKVKFLVSKKIKYYDETKKEKLYGEYVLEKNKIIVYIKLCRTFKDIVSSVIHEYTHYLQPNYKHIIYFKTYTYKKNPFEIEAKKNEDLYTDICLKDIKNQVRISNSVTSFKKNK